MNARMNDKTSDLEDVRQNLDSWMAAFNAKDLDALFRLYDEDSIYANAAAPLMQGIDQIKPWYAQAFTAIEGTLLHKEEAAIVEGDLAMLLGAYYFKPHDTAKASEESQLTGRVVLIYRRSASGDWKLLFDMDNTPPDVSPALFN